MIRLQLPKPPSSNQLFPTGKNGMRHRSKAYNIWLGVAEPTVWLTKFLPIAGPVVIRLTLEDEGRIDLPNYEKALVDLCVRHKIIEDDKRAILRKLIMQWGKEEGAVVEIWSVTERGCP